MMRLINNKLVQKTLQVLCIVISCNSFGQNVCSKSNYENVDPFIGTGGHGHTYPGATMPFGMVQLSPDTRLDGWDGCSGYHYTDTIIYGFSHTHLSGTGVSDYGDVLLMPAQGNVEFENGSSQGANKGYASWFNKKTEKASPGFYQVNLAEHNIDVRLTATTRVGIHEYTFNNSDTSHVILDLTHRDKVIESNIKIVNKKEVEGYRISSGWAAKQHIYFVIQFSKEWIDNSYDKSNTPTGNEEKTKVALRYSTKAGDRLVVKVGISSVSIDEARKNLNIEAPHWDFEKYKNQAKQIWEKQLSKIEVKSSNQDDISIFYSSLYHTMIVPNVFSDVSGKYRGMDQQIHQSDNTNVYSVFSLWDTFRATHPLYTIIEQEKTKEFIDTFLKHYTQGGRLPVWELAANETECMIGYHATSVITDAFVKGIKNFDANTAFKAMQHSSNLNHFGLEFYKNKGMIESGDEGESVSKTLEYAYDDWCIAELAKQLKNDSVYSEYTERAQYYKNLFNPETGFMQPKHNGGWSLNFKPEEVNYNFTEANSWQYSMFAPHDISGLISLYGGEQRFEKKLDELFSAESKLSGRHQVDITGLIGQYAHGNEPSHHMAYLYNYIGKPWKTQEKVQRILTEQYKNAPDGLSGNEDCGQMSAWYVLSAMGFYSVTPGLDYYTIGKPHFDEVTIKLENGNSFKIITQNNSRKNCYIQKAYLNGIEYNKSYINHQDIMRGGKLVFEMGDKPNYSWGSKAESRPVSQIMENKQITTVPFFVSNSQSFKDSTQIMIKSIEEGVKIYYRLSESDEFILYSKPIQISNSASIEAFCIKNNTKSHSVKAFYKKMKSERSIQLESKYSNQYSAGGNHALIDGLKGNNNYKSGYWQGYNFDLLATVDLGSVEYVKYISIGALQDIQSWIFYPPQINIYISENGNDFKKLTEIKNDFPDNKYGAFNKLYEYKVNEVVKARYVKIEAPSYGLCPEWHLGNGNQSMLFFDEITIE